MDAERECARLGWARPRARTRVRVHLLHVVRHGLDALEYRRAAWQQVFLRPGKEARQARVGAAALAVRSSAARPQRARARLQLGLHVPEQRGKVLAHPVALFAL